VLELTFRIAGPMVWDERTDLAPPALIVTRLSSSSTILALFATPFFTPCLMKRSLRRKASEYGYSVVTDSRPPYGPSALASRTGFGIVGESWPHAHQVKWPMGGESVLLADDIEATSALVTRGELI
jgi:hypothetical protein